MLKNFLVPKKHSSQLSSNQLTKRIMVPKTRDSHFTGHSKRIMVPKKRGTLILGDISLLMKLGKRSKMLCRIYLGKTAGEIDRFNGGFWIFLEVKNDLPILGHKNLRLGDVGEL